jgi:hypothetical protein
MLHAAGHTLAGVGLAAVMVDALPERLWRPGNFYHLPGGDWHFCVGRSGRPSVRTVEWRGREIAYGRRPFNYAAHDTDPEPTDL